LAFGGIALVSIAVLCQGIKQIKFKTWWRKQPVEDQTS